MGVRMNISWNPVDYARHSSSQLSWAREHLRRLDLRGHERILDLGCGDGKVTAEIAAQVANGCVVGVDSSPGMAKFARSTYPSTRHPNLWFQLADVRSLPFHRGFDLVFSNSALHWVQDHRPILDGIAQALRPSGRLYLSMGGKGTGAGIFAELAGMQATPEWATWLHGFSNPYGLHGPDEYREWLILAGLTPTHIELVEREMVFDGRNGVTGWIRTTWMAYTRRIPEVRRTDFIDELVARILNRYPPAEDGLTYIPMINLVAEATASRHPANVPASGGLRP